MADFAPNNNTSSSGLVQSHSITAQFNSLSVDLENFRNAKEVAQSNHEKVQGNLDQLRKEQAVLLAQIQVNQEALGALTRKRDMFGNEKARLDGAMDRERKALEACVRHTQALGDKSDEATLQYAKEMGEANNQVAGYLQQEIQTKVVALLSVPSVQEVATPKLPRDLDPKVQHSYYGALHFLCNGKGSWDKEKSRHALLRSKFQDVDLPAGLGGSGDVGLSGGEGVLYARNHRQQQMDLFYGLDTETIGVEMALS